MPQTTNISKHFPFKTKIEMIFYLIDGAKLDRELRLDEVSNEKFRKNFVRDRHLCTVGMLQYHEIVPKSA